MPSFDALDSSSFSTLEEKLAQCQEEDSDIDATFTETQGQGYPDTKDDFEPKVQDSGLDHHEEEEMPEPEMDSEQPQAEPIEFVPEHFKRPDTNNEQSLEEGLDFPDVEEVLASEEVASSPGYLQAQSQVLSDAASKTSQVVSQTVSSIMSGTMTGLNLLSQTVAKARGGDGSPQPQPESQGEIQSQAEQAPDVTGQLLSEKVDAGVDETGGSSESKTAGVSSAKETDAIEADFEFLDRDDFDSME